MNKGDELETVTGLGECLTGRNPGGFLDSNELWMGEKGPRLYEWALLNANCPKPRVYKRWLLFRRSVKNPDEVVCFACGGSPETTIAHLVNVAGTRWAIEDLFELAKGDCGLDEYEVRSWVGWYRHVTLSLWGLATLAVIRRRAKRKGSKKRKNSSS